MMHQVISSEALANRGAEAMAILAERLQKDILLADAIALAGSIEQIDALLAGKKKRKVPVRRVAKCKPTQLAFEFESIEAFDIEDGEADHRSSTPPAEPLAAPLPLSAEQFSADLAEAQLLVAEFDDRTSVADELGIEPGSQASGILDWQFADVAVQTPLSMMMAKPMSWARDPTKCSQTTARLPMGSKPKANPSRGRRGATDAVSALIATYVGREDVKLQLFEVPDFYGGSRVRIAETW